MSAINYDEYNISVVIPCYRETQHVLNVIARIPNYINKIICIDDCCPDNTGEHIKKNCTDKRVEVIRHDKNQGVGGAMITGYKVALKNDADIVIKIDGDEQMDPELIPQFINPIINGYSDYTKGNRFYDIENVSLMPKMRLLGNAILSFMSKLSTGYWKIFDPNNGYTAIHSRVLKLIPLLKISKSYFFESDMLFRLNTLRAVVVDIPMQAKYKDEISNLFIFRSIIEFSIKHSNNFLKRIFYNYFLRDFHIASIELLFGPIMLLYGIHFGIDKWIISITTGLHATAGQVMNAALPTIIGLQLTLSALSFDIDNSPNVPLHTSLD